LQADAYQHTGCRNVICPGFVQTNKNVVIGGTLTPTSTYDGNQLVIPISIWRVTHLYFTSLSNYFSPFVFSQKGCPKGTH